MSWTRRLNYALLALFLVTLGLNGVLRPDPTRPNFEWLPEMVRTPRYNAFAANPNFADGKTLRAPVLGTIPRGPLPAHFAATPEDALRAGRELQNPLAPTDRGALDRGTGVYTSFCLPCHGAGGRGDGPVIARGFPAPPSLLADHAVQLPDGQMWHILTYGQKNMPSYAAQVAPEDRWKVILYVRSLQKSASPAVPGGTR